MTVPNRSGNVRFDLQGQLSFSQEKFVAQKLVDDQIGRRQWFVFYCYFLSSLFFFVSLFLLFFFFFILAKIKKI